MKGNFIDNMRFRWRAPLQLDDGYFYLDTDYGKIRVLDTKGNKPVLINVPDGPNVIEHQLSLVKKLSENYRVICFEYPGLGFSYPDSKYDYTFKSGSNLLVQLMDSLNIRKATLIFSCSNGFYALQAASDYPERIKHIFLAQTPSFQAMIQWSEKSIPALLKVPVVGQLTNAIFVKQLVSNWYKYALPKNSVDRFEYSKTAITSLTKGGCFCLSSLVHGLKKDYNTPLSLQKIPTTLVWGGMDFTHRMTDKKSLKTHVENCEIIEFEECGHFPELERTKDFTQMIKERIT
ncbi:MAG: alpha/beta hydrolase [Cyclobacteriaceae bacterium]|nr:alpha/beta hydrolase [Cyclobacteriaceae bacterium]